MSAKELEKLIADMTKQMKKAAAELNFEAPRSCVTSW